MSLLQENSIWIGPHLNLGQPGKVRGVWGSRGSLERTPALHISDLQGRQFHVISSPHFTQHTTTVTLRNIKRKNTYAGSGANFSEGKMKGQCSLGMTNKMKQSRKGRVPTSTYFTCGFPVCTFSSWRSSYKPYLTLPMHLSILLTKPAKLHVTP